MISSILMSAVVALLAITFIVARRTRLRQSQLERDNHAMQRELERHRQTVHSILRELQNP